MMAHSILGQIMKRIRVFVAQVAYGEVYCHEKGERHATVDVVDVFVFSVFGNISYLETAHYRFLSKNIKLLAPGRMDSINTHLCLAHVYGGSLLLCSVKLKEQYPISIIPAYLLDGHAKVFPTAAGL